MYVFNNLSSAVAMESLYWHTFGRSAKKGKPIVAERPQIDLQHY